jgi:hypothetical protein
MAILRCEFFGALLLAARTGNVPATAITTEVSFTDPDETEMGNSDPEKENISYDQNMEGGSSKMEQPAGIKREDKWPKLTFIDIDKQHLDSLKEIGKRMRDTNSEYVRMFLFYETAVTIEQFELHG